MPTRRSCWATWSSKCNENNDVESLNQIEPIKLFSLILEAHCCCVAECLVLPFWQIDTLIRAATELQKSQPLGLSLSHMFVFEQPYSVYDWHINTSISLT